LLSREHEQRETALKVVAKGKVEDQEVEEDQIDSLEELRVLQEESRQEAETQSEQGKSCVHKDSVDVLEGVVEEGTGFETIVFVEVSTCPVPLVCLGQG
jgi:hypothetical protein